MELRDYEYISGDAGEVYTKKTYFGTPLLKQIFVCSATGLIYFVLGLSFGAPTVFIPQIRKEPNSTIYISEDMASWITSIHGYSALPWIFIIPAATRMIGRKIPFIIVCLNTIAGFIVFYFSNSAIQILISEIMQGLLLASCIPLLAVILTEYTSPQYRGVFLAIESVTFYWGVWVANLMGTFLHWKNIAIVAFVSSLYSLTSVVWPESPSWLAMKGRFDECAASHHWLKGFDKESENELVNLIKSQKEYLRAIDERNKRHPQTRFRSAIATLKKQSFYKPLLLCISVMSLQHFSGKGVCGMYAVDLINKITNSESAAYTAMLIMDGVTILSMQVGCILSKFLNRRTLLLGSSMFAIIFLFIISLYLFLIKLNVLEENNIVSILLLASFSIAISCGSLILPGCLIGELVFLRYKSSSLLLLTLYSELLMATILKLSPLMFNIFTLPGTFLFYTATSLLFTIVLYKYLPETKDKSLVEIESYFESRKKDEDVSQVLIDETKTNVSYSDNNKGYRN